MSDRAGEEERKVANAAHELFLLGRKTVEARAVLAALQDQLSDANNRLEDAQHVEQLIEANQQLVLAILLTQSDAIAAPQVEELLLLGAARSECAIGDRRTQRPGPSGHGRACTGPAEKHPGDGRP